MKCKVTNKTIKPFMSFGKMPLANGFLKKENFDEEFFFDLEDLYFLIQFAEKIFQFDFYLMKFVHMFPDP